VTGLELLDFSNEAMTVGALSDAYRPTAERDPWLARRTFAFGGSELAPLLFAYGLAPLAASPPTWVVEQAEHYARLGVPKLIAWKAGLRPRPKGDNAAKKAGRDREKELLGRYKATIAKQRVKPESIRHASSLPQQFYPLTHRRRVPIAVTPDAWARSVKSDGLVAIELKCSFRGGTLSVPWHYGVQLQAEIGVMEAIGGLLVVGDGWADEREPDGPVRAFPVSPHRETIGLCEAVATEAWSLVELLRSVPDDKHAGKQCARLWLASEERMRAYRSEESARVDAALEGLDFTGLDGLKDFAA
jgi:hypothetical protein